MWRAAVTLLMRHGQVVAFDTHGKADLMSEAPLGRDAVFRIYSMTKPVAGVALMILFEEGRWSLDDPVTRFLPELADLKVFAGRDASGAIQTTPAHRPPTMRELLSHTAGFGYGLFDIHPVERAYREAGVLRADQSGADGPARRRNAPDVRARHGVVLFHRRRPAGADRPATVGPEFRRFFCKAASSARLAWRTPGSRRGRIMPIGWRPCIATMAQGD